MGSPGKLIRMTRFKRRGAKAGLLVPIDHGFTMGPLPGIRTLAEIGAWIAHPAVGAIVAHKGMIERLATRDLLANVGVVVHLNGMPSFTAAPDRKELVTSVRAAGRLGADAVSVQVNFDGDADAHNLRLLGAVIDAAAREGLPVLTMLYDKVVHRDDNQRLSRLRHLIRIAVELGTDALKLAPPAPARLAWELPQILGDHGNDTAIYFAGGATTGDGELLRLARESVHWGAAGVCVGRNVFGREDPCRILTELDRALGGVSLPEERRGRIEAGIKLGVH